VEIKSTLNIESKLIEKCKPFVVAVHGGAGSYGRHSTTHVNEVAIKNGILEALKMGYESLKNNKSGLNTAESVTMELENNPLFNAGVGSKINEHFEIELDASIMNGKTLNCGSVAGTKIIKNPIKAAKKIMEETKHVMVIAGELDKWAKTQDLEIVPNSHFFTEQRIEEWHHLKEQTERKKETGTVGCVVLDTAGNLIAATSTGGTNLKMAGRVGDSPIIGAGTYANNNSVAVSCTGTGEIFIRNVAAFDIHARYMYKGLPLKEAALEVMGNLEKGDGGFISIDKKGDVFMPFNSGGMARGYVREDGIAHVYIFEDGEDLTPITYDLNEDVTFQQE
jgi:beta-aspartyl-peptidase (threonine type)